MSKGFLRPCLDCGVLARGSRCATHEQARNTMKYRNESPERKAKKRTLYDKDYQKKARAVRAGAYLCHICGGGGRAGDPFEADHLYPGQVGFTVTSSAPDM
jgi:5-methylcytosine-specific restriction endonuclease McrA